MPPLLSDDGAATTTSLLFVQRRQVLGGGPGLGGGHGGGRDGLMGDARGPSMPDGRHGQPPGLRDAMRDPGPGPMGGPGMRDQSAERSQSFCGLWLLIQLGVPFKPFAR